MEVRPLTLESYPEELNDLSCLVIPKSAKRKIRGQLALLGVSHRTVYPGLDGVARWLKSELSNFTV